MIAVPRKGKRSTTNTNKPCCFAVARLILLAVLFVFGILVGRQWDVLADFFTGKFPATGGGVRVAVLDQISRLQGHIQAHRPPRLLFMTASYTKNQLLSLQKTLDCMRDHCNAGWNVTVLVQMAWEDKAVEGENRLAELQDRLYCSATDSNIPLIIQPFGKIGFGLNSRHRVYMRDHLNDYDYFSYAEEDMLLTVSHLNAFLKSETELKRLFPRTWMRYQTGFLRYEDSRTDAERVSWEYFPDRIHAVDIYKDASKAAPPVKRRDLEGIYIVTNNLNQAIYVMPREQVQDLEQRCGFLTDIGQNEFFRELRRAMDKDWKYLSAGVSEWSSSYQQVLQCGVRRLVPAEHIQSFMIHHAEDKAQTRRLRSELLNARDWLRIVVEKAKRPITLQEAYDDIVFHQYNLHLIDPSKFAGKSRWSWPVEKE